MTQRKPSMSRLIRRLETLCAEIEVAENRATSFAPSDISWHLNASKKEAMKALDLLRSAEAVKFKGETP